MVNMPVDQVLTNMYFQNDPNDRPNWQSEAFEMCFHQRLKESYESEFNMDGTRKRKKTLSRTRAALMRTRESGQQSRSSLTARLK